MREIRTEQCGSLHPSIDSIIALQSLQLNPVWHHRAYGEGVWLPAVKVEVPEVSALSCRHDGACGDALV